MAAHESAVTDIVSGLNKYAEETNLAKLFHALLLGLIFDKPSDPLTHIADHVTKMKSQGAVVEPALPGREVDTEEGTKSYVDQQRLNDVLEELFTSVLYSKPEDPLTFVASECARLKSIKGMAKGAARLYTEDDLRAMFGLYDASKKGTITRAQVNAAFRNLGLKQSALDCPETVPIETFVKLARRAIDESS